MTRLMLTLVAAWAINSAAAPRVPVVAAVPQSMGEELEPLGLLIAARASRLLDGVSELHVKETLRVLNEEGVSVDDAPPLLALLGVDRVVVFRLVERDGFTMDLTVAAGKRQSSSQVSVGKSWNEAIERGGPALALAMLGRSPRTIDRTPASSSDEALLALGRCYRFIIHQPLGIDGPSPLDSTELEPAMEACRSAMAIDASLHLATASLALAEAVCGAEIDATQTLASLDEREEELLPAWLAQFWLLTRFQSNDAGLAFLGARVEQRPNDLLARASLGDALASTGAFARAEAIWRAYLKRAPASAWAYARLSKVLARQRRYPEAVAAAKKGLELSPKSRAARLELGLRLLDADQPLAAREQLKPLAEKKPARGTELLALGSAHARLGQVDQAASAYERALDAASTDAEWRIRARAFYELALLEAKRARPGAARVALRASERTGLKMRSVDPLLADAAREIERSDSGGMMDGGKSAAPPHGPKEASLFPLDRFGDPDPSAPKPPPPEGLAFFRF